jgi:hypothetical protein
MRQLPIYKIRNKYYFLDSRLAEYRNIKNPSDILSAYKVLPKDLQKQTVKDSIKVFGKKR